MNIILYNNASPSNKAVKELTQVASYDGYLREGTSIVNPHIMVEQATLPIFNYAYIEAFSRKYFVENVLNVNNNLWEIVMHCDVLSTYWDSIKEADCIVSRSEAKRIDKLIDNQIWTTVDSLYATYDFPNTPFANEGGDIERYVVLVAGAGTKEKSNTTLVPFNVSGETISGIKGISANGISWDWSNQAFWVPIGYTATWTFQCVHTGVLLWQTYTATWDSGNNQWVFTH